MSQSSASPEILARWRYEPELWRDFVRYESGIYRKSVKSAKLFIIGTIICAVVLITLFSVIPFLVTRKFDSSIWGPAFGIGFIAAICLVVGFIILRMRKEKIERLGTNTGEALITIDGLNINGVNFNWNYGESSGWQFLGAERKSVSVDPLKKIEILELKFITFIPSKNTPQRDEAEWRVPVQIGHEAEADRVIARLRSELSAFRG